MEDLKHSDLITAAHEWLARKGCVVIAIELSAGGGQEEPDAIGWKPDGYSMLIECKASRADFRQDGKKQWRSSPDRGVGIERFYLAPEGVIPSAEVPKNWGLLEIKTGMKMIYTRKKCEAGNPRNFESELRMLIRSVRHLKSPDFVVTASAFTMENKGRSLILFSEEK